MDSSVVSKRVFFLLFFLFLFTYTTFKFYVSDAMSAARTALGIALVSEGTLRVDAYVHFFTHDSTFRDGHHYACQAPGSALVALPTIALAHYSLKALGKDDFTAFDPRQPGVPSQAFGTVMLAGSLTISFFAALGAAMIYVLGIRFGVSQRTAVLVAVFFGLGTPYAMWATVLMGHALVAAFLVIAFAWGEALIRSRELGHGILVPGWLLTGFLLAFSVNVEYTAAIPAIVLGLTLLALMRRADLPWPRCWRIVGLLVLGAVPAAIFFFVYNALAFGSPFSLGYLQVADKHPLMEQGFAGVALPKVSVLLKSLFSPRFGILWFSPILILFPFAVYENLRQGFRRELNIACLSIVSYYFLLNASYGYWFHSINGPRHVTAALPFAFIPFLFMDRWPSIFLRRAVWLLGGYSLVVFSFAMFVPMSEIYWREYSKIPSIIAAFFSGEIRNLFYYAGLPVPVAMILPFLIWVTFGFLLWRTVRQESEKKM